MKDEIKLTTEQEQALAMMLSGRNVFLTGKAGTGKSTILRSFQEKCPRDCVFLAPTGIAAINIGGSTLHSFFQLKPGLLTPDSMEELRNRKRINLIRQVETIVIDEVSMVRSDLFAAIDARLREVTQISRPFGGKQIILVGDFFHCVAFQAEYIFIIRDGLFQRFYRDSEVFDVCEIHNMKIKD